MNRRKNICASASGAALALSCAFGFLLSHFLSYGATQTAPANSTRITFAAYRKADAAETPGAQRVTVSVDATKLLPADRNALESAAKQANGVLPPLPESYAAAKGLGRAGEWFCWGRLADRQAAITLSPSNSANSDGVKTSAESPAITAYAAAGTPGATALLVNTSANTVIVRYRIRLARGAYDMEILRFSPAKPELTLAAQENPAPIANYQTRLTHLDGCDFGPVHTAERLVILSPGEAALIRANNVARSAVGAYYHACELLSDLKPSAPGLSRRLRKMLRDGESGLQSLTLSTNRRGSGRRLEAIHHLLLLTAQAESLERNYLRRGAVKHTEGEALAAALEALSGALSQTSAVALNLVPQIEVIPDAEGGAKVAVSLRNGGNSSVDSVKLGLDDKTLPAQTVCQPPDPAYFGALRPGQSVETTFTIRSSAGENLAEFRYTADVSYLTASCPAHLRPRSQF